MDGNVLIRLGRLRGEAMGGWGKGEWREIKLSFVLLFVRQGCCRNFLEIFGDAVEDNYVHCAVR